MKKGKEEMKSEVKILQEKEHLAFKNKIFSYLENSICFIQRYR
jgi:hypothetical protein